MSRGYKKKDKKKKRKKIPCGKSHGFPHGEKDRKEREGWV